jgi:hypothetical protein
MRIKDPTLIDKRCTAEYEIDVEGTKVRAYYNYDSNHEANGGWEYDLYECYAGMTDEEMQELDEEFCSVIYDISV